MIKSGIYIIKLVFISLLIFLSVRCDKPENNPINKPVNSNPCPSPMHILLCIKAAPSNGAFVSPTNITIKWIAHENSTSSLYFGTNKDNLPCISRQSATSFVLKNLELNTTYYWYVTGELQCYYGCYTGISSFTTVPDTNLPYVITAPVFTHLNTPPRVGGKVWYEGSSKLFERGIYFGISPNPDIDGTKFQIGNGTDLFSDLLPGLNSSTTYYVKAYATNNSGTVFGPEVSFTTGQVSDYKSIQDIEGNIYYTINIGTQTWMAENLRTSSFNDGTLIPNITDDFNWETLGIPAYCWYNNNPGFKSTYGALYNWYTVDSTSNGHKNVCPSGWHVPDDSEWTTLATFLGGEAIAGIKLKEAGDYYWLPSTSMGDNSSDFSALAGGMRYNRSSSQPDGSSSPFSYIGDLAMWWSTATSLVLNGLQLSNNSGYTEDFVFQKNEGHSIRCIKDTK